MLKVQEFKGEKSLNKLGSRLRSGRWRFEGTRFKGVSSLKPEAQAASKEAAKENRRRREAKVAAMIAPLPWTEWNTKFVGLASLVPRGLQGMLSKIVLKNLPESRSDILKKN